MEQLLSAVFEEAVAGRVEASSATARLEGLLKGKTALREGAAWKHARDAGMLGHLSSKQAGSFLWEMWFIQQPTLIDGKTKVFGTKKRLDGDSNDSGDDDDDGSVLSILRRGLY